MTRSLMQRGRRRTMPGDLADTIRIEKETRTSDGAGGFTRSWALVASVAAAVQPIAATEREDRGAVRAVGQLRFTIYRRADVTETMRLTWNGVTYYIAAIDHDANDALFMVLLAEKGVAE
jgi:SPP1 family predicted phage head-tail adaptor